MNYRHVFHAGNFADVFKHGLLSLILARLNAKDKPYVYVETHAGAGRYDLGSEPARKTGEWRDGIARLWSRAGEFPELTGYLNAVRAANPGDRALRYYPGSPSIAQCMLRPTDRLLLCELAEDEAHRLYAELHADARVAVRRQDGYEALNSILPPAERRGLVLIDPPYEDPAEFSRAGSALIDAWRRWTTGVYALWYPVKDRAVVRRLHRKLTDSGIRRVLVTELGIYPEDSTHRLSGCGMLMINPPWKLDEDWGALLPRLARLLAEPYEPRTVVGWLVPE